MRVSILCFLLLIQFSLHCSLLHKPAFAAKQSYIIYLGPHPHGPNPTSADVDRAESYHHEFLGSILGSCDEAREAITSSYRRHINGFAAELEEEHAQQLANHPEVVSIFLNKPKIPLTTHAWNFLGLEKGNVIPPDSAWTKGRFGEDVIIGGVDSGVWPESASFNDRDMGPVPSKWRGICQNDTHFGVQCNRKLIGARFYNKGVVSFFRKKNSSFVTPPVLETARDFVGHGTHVLSTAGGSFAPNASVFGTGFGTAKGGSPRARVASYKVCWFGNKASSNKFNHREAAEEDDSDCSDQDCIQAIDDAISDGVDVLTISLGDDDGTFEYFKDGVAIGSFHAIIHGIPTVASAGNGGPAPETVNNPAPWILTVGASTTDRQFATYVTLGNQKRFRGIGLPSRPMPSQDSYPLITGEAACLPNGNVSAAIECKPGTLDPEKVKGKILVCIGTRHGLKEGLEASRAGAVGLIWGRGPGKTIRSETALPNYLPVSQLNPTDIASVFDYVKATQNPVASLTDAKTEFDVEPAPVMGSFSAKGPSKMDPAILKPDVTAPGVQVIAAFSKMVGPSGEDGDERRTDFNVMDGTSMSTPVVAGIVGLVKTFHPDWSPAAIKSAIMTTAFTKNAKNKTILDVNGTVATPFSYGAGHVNPNRAMDPGLVYDLTIDDYLGYLCNRHYNESILKKFVADPEKHPCPKSFDINSFNYPSIAIPELANSATVTRRVKNVGPPGTYKAQVSEIPGIKVNVEPNSLAFTRVGEEMTYKITFTAEGQDKPKDYVFGELTWSDGVHNVRSSIALKHKQQ